MKTATIPLRAHIARALCKARSLPAGAERNDRAAALFVDPDRIQHREEA
jgi:hypothetical protein